MATDSEIPATSNAHPSNESNEPPAISSGEKDTKSRQARSDKFMIVAAGIALASNGYFNNIMTMANATFRKQYPKEYTSATSTRVSNALLVGEIFGQVAIGLTCDYFGRKFAIIATTLMIVVSDVLATSSYAGTNNDAMFWIMTIARVIIGFGVGGGYPASSTSASEAANEHSPKNRGPIFMLVTNFPLSFGGPLANMVFVAVLTVCRYKHCDIVWRVCFGIGCIIPLSIFYFRMRMLNRILYRQGAIKKKVPYKLVLRYYWKSLIGTCGAWFIYDFVTFPNGVFSGTIIASLVPSDPDTVVLKTTIWNLILGVITIPGVIIGASLRDVIGRKNTMILGFSGYLIFGLVIACYYHKITKIFPLFVVLYGLMQSSGNLVPGYMLGLISLESYATSVRGTCYGISVAMGKVGAAVGTAAFTTIQTNFGKQWTFIIAAVFGVLGMLVTYFFVQDIRGQDSGAGDEKFKEYLVENGWDGKIEEGGKYLTGVAKEDVAMAVAEVGEM